MTLTIKPEHEALWSAVAAREGVTVEEYAQARIDEIGESYRRAAIEAAKREYDDMVTLAAALPEDKKAALIATVQQLAQEAGLK